MNKIEQTVMSFKTKYEEGFIDSEIDELIKQFNITKESFNEAFGCGHTCMLIDDHVVIYHCDVINAIARIKRGL